MPTPCNHVALCGDCADTISQERSPVCPVCHSEARSFLEVFLAGLPSTSTSTPGTSSAATTPSPRTTTTVPGAQPEAQPVQDPAFFRAPEAQLSEPAFFRQEAVETASAEEALSIVAPTSQASPAALQAFGTATDWETGHYRRACEIFNSFYETPVSRSRTARRFYVVWRIRSSAEYAGIHVGEGTAAYDGIINVAGGAIGGVKFRRVYSFAEARLVYTAEAGLHRVSITPALFEW
jgi:hypothetical protein